MVVVFLPDATGGNPYQSNLANSLDEDVVIRDRVLFDERESLFPILSALPTDRDVTAIHFHWLQPYIFSKSASRTVIRLLLTIVQLLVVRLMGIPVVWTVHDVISEQSSEFGYPKLERWFKHAFIRFGFCNHIFVHCESARTAVLQEYNLPDRLRGRVTIVPHGNYLDNYSDEVSTKEARSRLGLDDEKTVFLFFGQIRPYKGVEQLIDAFKLLGGEQYRLLVVGLPLNESIEETVQQKSAEDSRIRTTLEFIPDEEIQVYMNAADVVVLPFNEITTSGSAILAMSFGKAIIMPRLGCLPELVNENGAIMYSPDNEGGLLEALESSQDHNLDAMGDYNLELAHEYDWASIASTTRDRYYRR